MGSTAHGGLTYADLLAYPEDDGIKRELFDGELVVSPSPAYRHQRVASRLLFVLEMWAQTNQAEITPGCDLARVSWLVVGLAVNLLVIGRFLVAWLYYPCQRLGA
ncbi:MAG: hypothetical protein ACRDZ4_20670 [Egibacteraceae bacterium]